MSIVREVAKTWLKPFTFSRTLNERGGHDVVLLLSPLWCFLITFCVIQLTCGY